MKTIVMMAALAAWSAGMAQATVLTFDGDICSASDGLGAPTGPPVACGNGMLIHESYGDMTGLNVQWNDGSADPFRMFYFENGYGPATMQKVGYATGVLLLPLPGYTVTLNGFDLGVYGAGEASVTVTIYGPGGTALQNLNPTVPADTVYHYSGSDVSADGTYGILISWQDRVNVGIDNIDFTVTADGSGDVPEPATLGLAGLALMGMGVWRRRH